MNALYPQAPWPLSFSYARALQQPVLETWRGKSENRRAAQQIFHQRARLNSFARMGLYKPEMEPAALAA
jgi:fructose-bisphosphate aldolase class I